MKAAAIPSVLVLVLTSFFGSAAFANGYRLRLNVPLYSELLPVGGKLRCDLSKGGPIFYLLHRIDQENIRVESRDKATGELSGEPMNSVIKDYGTPFQLWISFHSRLGEFGSYYEFLISRKFDGVSPGFGGYTMFTEAEYSMEEGKEKESFKPVAKVAVRCSPVNP